MIHTFLKLMFNFLIPFSHSYQVLHPSLLRVRDYYLRHLDSSPTKPLSVDPQQEPISVEVTDASTTAENVNFSLTLVEVFSLTF